MKASPYQGGHVSYSAGAFTNIENERSIGMTQYLSDKEGAKLDPVAVGLPPDFPKGMTMEVRFVPLGDFTRLVIDIHGWQPTPMSTFAHSGWHRSIDKLEDMLLGK